MIRYLASVQISPAVSIIFFFFTIGWKINIHTKFNFLVCYVLLRSFNLKTPLSLSFFLPLLKNLDHLFYKISYILENFNAIANPNPWMYFFFFFWLCLKHLY